MWHHHPKIDRCVETLQQGGVIVYPTEAVWGLGCDPFNGHAIEQVLALKRRHWSKGLILVAAHIAQFDFLLYDLPKAQRDQLEQSWPGHISWLVPHHGRVSRLVTGVHDTIALRVSTHPVVRALCENFGAPIVSTSANPQGKQPARRAFTARRYFAHCDVTFAPGVVGAEGKPSTIKDLVTGKLIR